MASKLPKIDFKAGDDFKLDFTLSDTNQITAIETKESLDAATADLVLLKKAVPQDAQAITDKTAVVDALQAAYDQLVLMNISTWGISSQIRWNGTLIDNFEIDTTQAAIGTFTLICASEKTVLWKPREYDVDIQFTRDVGKISSQTFIVNVERDVTNV